MFKNFHTCNIMIFNIIFRSAAFIFYFFFIYILIKFISYKHKEFDNYAIIRCFLTSSYNNTTIITAQL